MKRFSGISGRAIILCSVSLCCIVALVVSLFTWKNSNSNSVEAENQAVAVNSEVTLAAHTLDINDLTALVNYFDYQRMIASPKKVYSEISKITDTYKITDGVLIDTKHNLKLLYPMLIKDSSSNKYYILSLSIDGYLQLNGMDEGYITSFVVNLHHPALEHEPKKVLAYTMLYSIVYDEIAQTISVWSFGYKISSNQLPDSNEIVYCGYSNEGYVFRCGTDVIAFAESNAAIPNLASELIATNVQQVLDTNYFFNSDNSNLILLLTTDGEVKVCYQGELVDPIYEGSYNSSLVRN